MSSCSENIFQTPFGNKTLVVDTLHYDQTIISGIKNLNIPASGNLLTQNKAGNFNDLSAEFVIKFTNFVALTGLPDSVDLTINNANIVMHKANYWGNESNISLDLFMVSNDTSLYWENVSDADEVFSSLEGQNTYYTTVNMPAGADSLVIPVDITTVGDWYKRPDSLYVNNGLIVRKTDASNGMAAFHSIEYSSSTTDKRPRLFLECSLHDTNGVYLKDSTFYVIGGGDIQYTESLAEIEDSLFYLSQGNIFRSFLMMDSLRTDTLLGPTRLLNRAKQTFVIDKMNTMIGSNDTLYITARLFRTDHWDNDSISYMFTVNSDVFTELDDTVRIDISQLLQYMVSSPKEMNYEGIFFYLNNEYNDFNNLTIDPAMTELDIIYTKVRNE